MALLDRYMLMPLLPENPYHDPPKGFVAPAEVLVQGVLDRDANGLWRRDKLPPPRAEIVEGMKRVKQFVKGEPNSKLKFSDKGGELFRLIDSVNWTAAEHLQYTDENKAARLRQLQRFLYIFAGGHLLMDEMAGIAGADGGEAREAATVDNTEVSDSHVIRATCHLAAIWEGHESFINPGR